ncbi:MAG TPA: class I SAM-dependent RNA methyltransferase [Pyrinomonadaceae bacterium]|nr:class I SAM-dependent RNA methyltransferase [Pyrinomonadaceae bacterium]
MVLEVEVERILPGGMGLAHAGGKTVFVSLAAPGDRLRVRVEREQGNVLFASIEEIVTPSPLRIEPPCPYFGRCGGCDFQQLTYEAQLIAKAEIIRDCLRRIARLESVPDFVVTPSPDNWRYRMRAMWQIDREQRAIGYYERGSRRVCDVVDCAVLRPALQEKLEEVRATEWRQFPEGLKHLDVVQGENGVSFAPEFAGFHTSELSLTVRGEVYQFNAEAFFQINPSLLEPLIDFALGDASGESVLDLYCGVGLFTLPLARRFKNVVGVEANSAAVRFARRNLQNAELANARVITATVTDWFRTGPVGPVDFVFLDPPRAGAESVVIKGIVDLRPGAISYVSCDPATLARDLKKLIAGGYAIDSIAAFDLFPQTHHVETVVRLS